MRSHSTLARLQQVITLSLLIGATAWLAWHWKRSPWLAVAGFLFLVMGYSLVLGIEFIAMRFVGRTDPAPRPTWVQLARAWLGETLSAPRVFSWWQPFRWLAIPDQLTAAPGAPQRGTVFIHGFVCNRGFWTPWLTRMKATGQPFIAVNLEPVFGSIDDYVDIIDDAVQRITQSTGLLPVLVCHSMGGLAARAWLGAKQGHDRVHHVITIGSPHRGTWLGRFSHLPNGRQMRMESEWLLQLERLTDPDHGRHFTCWYSNCDNIVFPASTATLSGADNRLILGVAHVDLGFHPDVMAASLEKIAR